MCLYHLALLQLLLLPFLVGLTEPVVPRQDERGRAQPQLPSLWAAVGEVPAEVKLGDEGGGVRGGREGGGRKERRRGERTRATSVRRTTSELSPSCSPPGGAYPGWAEGSSDVGSWRRFLRCNSNNLRRRCICVCVWVARHCVGQCRGARLEICESYYEYRSLSSKVTFFQN